MVIITVVVAALLLLMTATQTTYPEGSLVRSRTFRISAIGIALLSAVLMVISAYRDERSKDAADRAQDELRQATEGLSRTAFLKDIGFELHSRGKIIEDSQPQTGFSGAFVNVYVVPEGSPHFCEWPVTHTPNLSGQGAIFELKSAPSQVGLYQLGLSQGVQMISFRAVLEPTNSIQKLSEPTLVDDHRRRTLEEYESSYFIAEISGDVSDVKDSALLLKGSRVPFIFQRADDRWIGITVFRPTWELRCEKKTAGAPRQHP